MSTRPLDPWYLDCVSWLVKTSDVLYYA